MLLARTRNAARGRALRECYLYRAGCLMTQVASTREKVDGLHRRYQWAFLRWQVMFPFSGYILTGCLLGGEAGLVPEDIFCGCGCRTYAEF